MSFNAIDLYTAGLTFFDVQVDATPNKVWEQPSPCDGWSALDVLGHVGVINRMGVAILRDEAPNFDLPDPPAVAIDGEPIAWWKQGLAEAHTALGALTEADLDREIDGLVERLPLRDGLTFPGADLFLHGWDLAATGGRVIVMPEDAIAYLTKVFESLPEEAIRRPGLFGPAVEVPEGATGTEQLVGLAGRRVG